MLWDWLKFVAGLTNGANFHHSPNYQLAGDSFYCMSSYILHEKRKAVLHSLMNTHRGPNDAIWNCRTWSALVQVMACRLFGTKPLPEPVLTYSLSYISFSGTNFFEIWINIQNFKENLFENVVCKIAAILSRPHCSMRWMFYPWASPWIANLI